MPPQVTTEGMQVEHSPPQCISLALHLQVCILGHNCHPDRFVVRLPSWRHTLWPGGTTPLKVNIIIIFGRKCLVIDRRQLTVWGSTCFITPLRIACILISTYKSWQHVSTEETGFSGSGRILASCLHKQKVCFGFIWKCGERHNNWQFAINHFRPCEPWLDTLAVG